MFVRSIVKRVVGISLSALLSSGSSLGLLDVLSSGGERDILERIADPLDTSEIRVHPTLTPELYQQAFDPPQMGECPSVVVIAARGSEQNNQIRPARYSADAAWTSNGFEERNIRLLFGRMEEHHVNTTGESVMDGVYIMGLTDVDYPASLPLSSEGSSAIELGTSLSSGRDNVMTAVDRFEAETACSPKYLVVGYSQGVMVVDGQEEELIRRDQYAGTVLISNPAQNRDDPTLIGHRTVTGGILSSLQPPELLHPNKISFCVPADIVCDRGFEQFSASGSSVAAAQLSSGNSRNGRVHLQYFVQESPWDEQIFEEIAQWIVEASEV